MLTEDPITSILVAPSSAGLNKMRQTVVLDNYDPAHLRSYTAPPAYMGFFSVDYLQLHTEDCLMGPVLHEQGQFLLSI